MVEPINLRQFRKQKQRDEKESIADENRKRHGHSTKIKKQIQALNELDGKKLDGHKLNNDEDS